MHLPKSGGTGQRTSFFCPLSAPEKPQKGFYWLICIIYILLESDIRYVTSPPPSTFNRCKQQPFRSMRGGHIDWETDDDLGPARRLFLAFPTSVDFTVESWYIVIIVLDERIIRYDILKQFIIQRGTLCKTMIVDFFYFRSTRIELVANKLWL